MHTNQTAFTQACLHLMRDQYEPSLDRSVCKYAGPNDNSCAVGCLLPRELGVKLDDYGSLKWDNLILRNEAVVVEVQEYLKGVSSDLLQDLQTTHDARLKRPRRWERLQEIAQKYGLELPEIDPNAKDAYL